MKRFVRSCGFALVIGGILLILINSVFTPLMPEEAGEEAVRKSTIYLFRMVASAVTALLLVFGCLGLYLTQINSSGIFGKIAFLTAFTGNCLLFAIEWTNIFVLRPLAYSNPKILEDLDKSPLMTAGFISAVSIFAVGWLLLTISVFFAKVIPRSASITTLIGLFSVPIFGAIFGLPGNIVASIILGAGLAGMGYFVVSHPIKDFA